MSDSWELHLQIITLKKQLDELKGSEESRNCEIAKLRKSIKEYEQAKNDAETALKKEKSTHEEMVAVLNTEIVELSKRRKELEQNQKTAEASLDKERKQIEDSIIDQEKLKHEDRCKERQNFVVAALSEAEKLIGESLEQFENPRHDGNTCTPEYLLNRLENVPGLADQLSSKYLSYQTDSHEVIPFVCCTVSFSHLLCECILNGKSASHSAPVKDAEDLLALCESIGMWTIELFSVFKDQDAGSQSVTEKVDEIKKHVKEIADMAKVLSSTEQDSAEKLVLAVDEEISNTAQLVADAASRIEEMLYKSSEKYSGVQLEVNERILDSCTALMKAIEVLIHKSKDLQQEIVTEGQGSATAKEFYKRHSRWTEGLLSAAKAVGWGAKMLVDSADKVVQGKGKFEEIIVSSNEISASTAQLVAASRVKADRESSKLSALQSASREVVEATAGVVASAKTGAEMIAEKKTVPDYTKLTLTQAKRLEMEAQVRVLELESRLTHEREKLGQLRRVHYQLAHVEENGGEAAS